MNEPGDLSFDPSSFSGRVRLFPLPNLVLFPHVLQPLHVFEPRYRALTEEALAEDRLMAMAVLAPGWEKDYEGRPKLRPFACLGRIVTHQVVEGGKYNLLLAGLRRVRILGELPPTKAFREARVEIVEDRYRDERAAARAGLQRSLLTAFRRVLPHMPEMHKQLDELLCTDVSLGMLTDLMAYTLQLPLDAKDGLLREADVDDRCRMLLSLLESSPPEATDDERRLRTPDGKTWPPDFSAN